MSKIIPVEITRTVETTTTSTMKIRGTDLIAMLVRHGHCIPPGVTVTFHVPGGGDWSHADVEINDEHPITVSWSTREVR